MPADDLVINVRQLSHHDEKVAFLRRCPADDRLIWGIDAGGDERQQFWLLEPGGEPRALTEAPDTIQKVADVLKKAGGSLNDVVRTRMFVTDISRWEEYGKAHGEFFKNIKPCTSMIEVKGLIAPHSLSRS